MKSSAKKSKEKNYNSACNVGHEEETNLDAKETPPARPTEFPKGAKIANKYKVVKLLGQGAMGQVYLVENLEIPNKPSYALKVMLLDVTGQSQSTARFLEEISVLRQIQHPQLIAIRDSGYLSGETFYFTMEYYKGITLREYNKKQKIWKVEAGLLLMKKILEGLQYLHGRGIIHRDLKPENIMIISTNNPIILDMGIARQFDRKNDITQQGHSLGTPYYMSPEQGLAERCKATTDIYSAGIILYEMLTGKRPFEGDSLLEIASKKLQSPPSARRKNAAIPRQVDAIIHKSLQPKAEDRYASAEEMQQEIEKFLSKPTKLPIIAIIFLLSLVSLVCICIVLFFFFFAKTIRVPQTYASIQKAIEMAQPGYRILIAAGTYRETIVCKKTVRLQGEDQNKVIIYASNADVISLTDCHDVEISGLTLRHGRNLINVKNATAKICDCVIEKGIWHGMQITNNSKVTITRCRIEKNLHCGIYISGEGSFADISDTICKSNNRHGICINDKSRAKVTSSTCTGNGNKNGQKKLGAGIAVIGAINVKIVKNACQQNGTHGIYLANVKQSQICENVCCKNKRSGIAVLSNRWACILKNYCSGNTQHGIFLSRGTKVHSEGNVLLNNIWMGICVCGKETEAQLIDNRAINNGENGIILQEKASGKAERNDCSQNKHAGIAVQEANLFAVHNCCYDNDYGIYLSPEASVRLEKNKFRGNRLEDIHKYKNR